MSFSVLQIAYYHTLMETRETMLVHDGYKVVSVLGNEQGMTIAGKGRFDVIVVGFSAPFAERTKMVRWLKQHVPEVPVIALLLHSGEHFPEADLATFSEDPKGWLEAVRRACQPSS
jgi:DNA-binding NarL/FixJ family response regulator